MKHAANIANLTTHQAEIACDVLAEYADTGFVAIEDLGSAVSFDDLLSAIETVYLFTGRTELRPIGQILRHGFSNC